MSGLRKHVVVLCRDAGGGGGVALVARNHAQQLAAEFRVTLLSDLLPDGVEGLAIRPRSFHALRRFAHVPNEIAFARAARKALLAMRGVDFVLCEGDVPAALAGCAAKRKHGTPFGIVTHGDMASRPRGTFDRRLSALYRWAERRSARDADLVVALGPAMADLASHRGARDEAIAIVPNGVDVRDLGLDGDSEIERPLREGKLSLIYAGRIAIEKGVLVLIDAMRILQTGAHLVIVGDGPLDEEVRVRASALDVEFVGAQPRLSLGPLFQAADLAIVPSLNEPFGLVVIEALACGTPVVASNVDNIPMIVRDGDNGLLVPPGDAAALAGAIESLARDRRRLHAMHLRARPSVLPRFSWPESGRLLRDAVRARLRDNR